jgi:putative protease
MPVRVASPRILKPTEQNLEKFLLSLDAELLVRSGGLLEGLQDAPNHPVLIGDFSLNAANVLTTRALLDLGLTRITPTHDLNARQITELAGLVGPERLEVIAYQHLPVFHTEHCVFCRFLSEGTDYTNCGHPCESHRVALRDERGVQHPVMADVGCRNTVFEGRPQVAGLHLEDWLAAGLRDFRLEFVHETPEQVRGVIRLHRAALAGELDLAELQEGLDTLADQGTTEGSLFVPNDFGTLDALPLLG